MWCGELDIFFSSIILFSSILLVFKIVNIVLGDCSGKGTPGNIPNPEVKLASADGT